VSLKLGVNFLFWRPAAGSRVDGAVQRSRERTEDVFSAGVRSRGRPADPVRRYPGGGQRGGSRGGQRRRAAQAGGVPAKDRDEIPYARRGERAGLGWSAAGQVVGARRGLRR
jgi:hypothetical protein